MTTTAVDTVTCGLCQVAVTPTREGGTRPREHNNPAGEQCDGPRQSYRPPNCTRCGKAPDAPDACASPLYHPEQWTDPDTGRLVGNAAAAGEIVSVAGPQYQWLVKQPPPGPRRAPAHVGLRHDGVRFYDLEQVREYVRHRPGPGRTG